VVNTSIDFAGSPRPRTPLCAELRLRELRGEQSSQAAELSRLTSAYDKTLDSALKLEAEREAASSQVRDVLATRLDGPHEGKYFQAVQSL